ncbi:MAG: hypothetical protein ABII06_08150, partial [Pseudomonadota bacterium]
AGFLIGGRKVIQENEIVMLLLGIGVFIFTLVNRSTLKRIPSWEILIGGFYVLLAGWVLTVLEGFLWKDLFNYLEHICYTGSSLFMALWCWKVFGNHREAE